MTKISIKTTECSVSVLASTGVLLLFAYLFHLEGEKTSNILIVMGIMLVVGMCASYIHAFPGTYERR